MYLRIAIYVRVSTDDPRQASSYELQKAYYEDFVRKHPKWELVEIYADDGISGTSLKHRDSFLKMISDCKQKKIDLIITKSVSRFARNVEDFMGTIHMLSDMRPPVGVFFETENLSSLNDDTSLGLSFQATMAEEESHNKSRSMETSLRMRLDHGLPLTPEKMVSCFKHRLWADQYLITTGLIGTTKLLAVLMDNDMDDVAYRLLLNEGTPGWLYSVLAGATTIPERWNSISPDGTLLGEGMNSLDHPFFGSVCETIYGKVVGLENQAPGWKKASFRPHPDARLGFAEMEIDTVSGTWKAGWRFQADGQITVYLTVPSGASADIILPSSEQKEAIHILGGDFTQTYLPERDYLHPFDENALVMDAMRYPEANTVLRSYFPDDDGAWEFHEDEWPMTTLKVAAGRLTFEQGCEMMAKMKAISVFKQ